MRKIILMLAVMFCFGIVYGQPGVRHPIDRIGEYERENFGVEQQAKFLAVTGNKTNPLSWTKKAGQRQGVNYVINIEGKKLTRPYVELVESAIDQLIFATVQVGILAGRPLEFYFMSGLYGGGPTPKFISIEQYYGLGTVGVMTFTHDDNFNRVNRIVTIAKPKNRQYTIGRLVQGMAHILHLETLGEVAYVGWMSEFNGGAGGPKGGYQKEPLAVHVSDWAEHSRKEFVAELFTYVVMGKELTVLPTGAVLDDALARLVKLRYEFYLGPVVNFVNR